MASATRWWTPSKGKGTAPHRPTLGASVVAALVAVGVVMGFVVIRTSTPSSPTRHTATPGTSSRLEPRTSLPAPVVPATSPPTSQAPAPSVPVQSPAPCTRDDVDITTSVDAAGGAAALLTRLQVLHACVFQPVPEPPYSCVTTLVATDRNGQQTWPAPGQGEQCSQLSGGVLAAGSVDSVRSVWSRPPTGSFVAVGTWAWSAGPGLAPVVVSARSAPFTVS